MAVNTARSRLSSRRVQNWLPWLGAVVLAAGVIAFVVVRFGGNTAPKEQVNPTGPQVQFPKAQKNIAFPSEAWAVARKFAFTAVSRKHLGESYILSDPKSDVRGGFTMKQWLTGTIPVVYYPVAKMHKTNWKNTNYAHPRDVQTSAVLIPRAHSGQRPITVEIGLTKIGTGANAHWAVNYFAPIAGPPVPAEG
jgi:hypothetical protein